MAPQNVAVMGEYLQWVFEGLRMIKLTGTNCIGELCSFIDISEC